MGRYCFITAGNTDTKSVPNYALMVGNPARQKGWMSRHGHKLPHPDADGVMRCPESGLRYQLQPVSDGQASGRQAYDDDPPAAETPGTDNQILRCLDVGENDPLPERLAIGSESYRQFR